MLSEESQTPLSLLVQIHTDATDEPDIICPFRHLLSSSTALWDWIAFYTEMQNRCLLQVLFASSLLILSKAQYVIGSDPSCVRSSPADDGRTRVTFLREDAAGVRTLHLSLWSEDARLLSCEGHTDPAATERYGALCDRSGTQDQEIMQRFNISALLAPDAPCAPKFSRRVRRDGTEGKSRRKRAWFFPGTLWCGTGSKAAKYEQLGMFEHADRCCREHDHCPHIIPALTVNYGVFNSKFFTVSHCDCDQRFRQCLSGVNDTIASMVGYSFFSILQVPCFELQQKRRCTEMYWSGICKKVSKAPYAVFKNPLPYNSTNASSKYEDNSNDSNTLDSREGQNATESPAIGQHTKSAKSEHSCSSKDPPRGDTLKGRRRKGKGCKRHRKLSTVAPSQMPSISRAHNTSPSMDTSLLRGSKNSTLMPNKKRAGKKKNTRQGQKTPPHKTTNIYPQTTSTTQKPTIVTSMDKTTKSRKKVPTQSPCCGFRTPLRGDTFQPHCKACQKQKTANHTATVPLSTTTHRLPVKVTTHSTASPARDNWSTATSSTPATTTLKRTASTEVGWPKKQMDSHLLWNNTNQEPMRGTKAANTHSVRGLKLNSALHNLTDNQLLCRSLKHLDECKYKIPPLEKKYDLQNMEPKTAYHCDCTSRLALQIESFKQPSALPALLMDFVSLNCFKLPRKKECHSRKSCSGGFAKASDLLQALKKIEEKATAGVRNSGNGRKRGIPVRLYKRCLRLEREREREADIMARLT